MKKNIALIACVLACGFLGLAHAQKLNIVPTPLYCNPVFEKQHQTAREAAQMPKQGPVAVQLTSASSLRSAGASIAPAAPGTPGIAQATAATQAVAIAATPAAPPVTFSVRQGETVREAVARWAKDAGWLHLPEHYTPDFDVLILGSLTTPFTDFKAATRTLLESTSMTSRALQPCFYSNNVVRVILKSQRCDVI